ncbi:MAG: MaoC family dehydratase [Gammaproteobacteria bacterium]
MGTETPGVYPQIRWFEDFATGQRFIFGAWEMTAESMIEFARVYDPEPFHLNEQAAREAGWDGLIASGLQIASIWRRLSKDAFPNSETVISPGWDEIRWTRPVYAGDVITSHTEITETRRLSSRPGEGLVRLANRLVRQDGEQVASLISNWFVRCQS